MTQPPDLEARVGGLESRVGGLESRVDNGFAEMRGRLDATAAGLQQIAGMLSTLISQRGDQ